MDHVKCALLSYVHVAIHGIDNSMALLNSSWSPFHMNSCMNMVWIGGGALYIGSTLYSVWRKFWCNQILVSCAGCLNKHPLKTSSSLFYRYNIGGGGPLAQSPSSPHPFLLCVDTTNYSHTLGMLKKDSKFWREDIYACSLSQQSTTTE